MSFEIVILLVVSSLAVTVVLLGIPVISVILVVAPSTKFQRDIVDGIPLNPNVLLPAGIAVLITAVSVVP